MQISKFSHSVKSCFYSHCEILIRLHFWVDGFGATFFIKSDDVFYSYFSNNYVAGVQFVFTSSRHQDNAPVHNSILVTDYLTKMGIKTVIRCPCDFWLFPKLRGCRYETIEEIKEAVTKVIDTLTQEDFHGAFQKLLERYKCLAGGGDYLEGD